MRIEIPDEDRDSVAAALRTRAAYWRRVRRATSDRELELASRLDRLAAAVERGGSPEAELAPDPAEGSRASVEEEREARHQAWRGCGHPRESYDDVALESLVRAVVPRDRMILASSYGILVGAAQIALHATRSRSDGLVYPDDVIQVMRAAIDTAQARSTPPRMRVVDALSLPEVLDGARWIALPLPECSLSQSLPRDFTLPGQTLGVRPERGRMYWCDGLYDPRAMRPSHFGAEAALTLPQLLGECTLVDAQRGPDR